MNDAAANDQVELAWRKRHIQQIAEDGRPGAELRGPGRLRQVEAKCVRAPFLELLQGPTVTAADFQYFHGFQIFLGQGSRFQQFAKILFWIVSVDEIGVSELSFFPQDPLPSEGPGITLIHARVPAGPIPKDAVVAFRTFDGCVLQSWEVP